MDVVVKAVLVSKSMFKEENEWYVRLEFAQEKISPPAFVNRSEDPLQSMIPMLQQMLKNIMPFQTGMFQRMILVLKEEEWEKLEKKPDIGEEITIKISDDKTITLK
ncbi:MAG: arcadin 1 [Thermoproteota archaeon]|jgi:hypothetical protein